MSEQHSNGYEDPQAKERDEGMIVAMTRIAEDLERVLMGIYACGALLAFICILSLLRLFLGR